MKPSEKIRADEREKIRAQLANGRKMKTAAAMVAKMSMTRELKNELGWR